MYSWPTTHPRSEAAHHVSPNLKDDIYWKVDLVGSNLKKITKLNQMWFSENSSKIQRISLGMHGYKRIEENDFKKYRLHKIVDHEFFFEVHMTSNQIRKW